MLDHPDKLEYQDPEGQMDRKESQVKQVLLGKLVYRVFKVQMVPLVKRAQMAMMVNLGQQEKLVTPETTVTQDLLVFLEYVVFVV